MKKENKHTQLEGISKSKEKFSLVTYIQYKMQAAAVLFIFAFAFAFAFAMQYRND